MRALYLIIVATFGSELLEVKVAFDSSNENCNKDADKCGDKEPCSSASHLNRTRNKKRGVHAFSHLEAQRET